MTSRIERDLGPIMRFKGLVFRVQRFLRSRRQSAQNPAERKPADSHGDDAMSTIDRESRRRRPPMSVSAVLLVVDDDRAVRHSLRRIFEESSIEVLTASTAEEGLKMAADRQPDVVLLDIMLPDRSGLGDVHRIAPARCASAGDLHYGRGKERDRHQGHEARRLRLPVEAAGLAASARLGASGH